MTLEKKLDIVCAYLGPNARMQIAVEFNVHPGHIKRACKNPEAKSKIGSKELIESLEKKFDFHLRKLSKELDRIL